MSAFPDARGRSRPLSDSGAKAWHYDPMRAANLADVIKVDLRSQLFRFSVDDKHLLWLELLDGKPLPVAYTNAPPEEVIERCRSLVDAERGYWVINSEMEIGPVYHRLLRRIRPHALLCFLELILHRV